MPILCLAIILSIVKQIKSKNVINIINRNKQKQNFHHTIKVKMLVYKQYNAEYIDGHLMAEQLIKKYIF